jgi:hypothetical protein
MEAEQMSETAEYVMGSAHEYGMPVAIYQGRPWPDWSVGLFGAVRDFPLQHDDVIVAGYEKSGTNWTQIMITNIYGWETWGTTAITLNHSVPTLENRGPYDICLNASSPRLVKTHLWRECVPQAWPTRGKVVNITRNPKDVCVSFFEELVYSRGMTLTWDRWVEAFARGRTVHGPWVDHTISWRTFVHPNLIHITYEETKRDPLGVMWRVADFLGRPYDPQRLEKAIADAEFSAMQKNEVKKQYAGMARKGVVGDWKNHFTPEQSDLFDRKIDAKLREHGIHLQYE